MGRPDKPECFGLRSPLRLVRAYKCDFSQAEEQINREPEPNACGGKSCECLVRDSARTQMFPSRIKAANP